MKSIAIYISAGNNDTFSEYCIKNFSEDCDIIINYYGNDNKYGDFLFKNCTKFSTIKTTKFISLKKNYNRFNIKKYNCVYVFDDDCIPIKGNLLGLYEIMMKYNLSLVSPSHDPKGKGLIELMHHKQGGHKFRYTNFIEMNFPVFSQEALYNYMKAYDGKLCGWGNDWWFCSVNNCNTQLNCGIYDQIIVKNPYNKDKKYTYGLLNDHTYKNIEKSEIDNFMTKGDRRNQWIHTMKKYNIREWKRQNLKFIY